MEIEKETTLATKETVEKTVKPVIEEGLKDELLKNTSQKETLETSQIKKEENLQKIGAVRKFIDRVLGKDMEKIMKKSELRMEGNPQLKAMFNETQKTDPERANKLKIAFGKFEYAKWDPKKNDYVDAGTYSVAAGEGTAGK